MGIYLNSSMPCSLYLSETKNPYFVDKTMILEDLFPLVERGKQYVCITRPRRFGKTVMANMIGAFFGKGADSPVFDGLNISKRSGYRQYMNAYNVIYVDFSKADDECDSYREYISTIKDILREDLREAFPNVRYRAKGNVAEDLLRITEETGQKFIFVFDEWDYIFHRDYAAEKDKKSYLSFLSMLLKDQPYVELAYMTGILPIANHTTYGTLESEDSIVDASGESLQAVFPADASYSSGSELNMFIEYTMSAQHKFGDYFGFTESEVNMLYQRYLENTEQPRVTREGLRRWYDGYHTLSGERLYNPRSVVAALANNQLADYWTSSGPYDEIFYYVKNNIADVRDDIVLMIAGESVWANVKQYAATATEIRTKDQIMSAMVVYGFLTCEDGKVSIPNQELMDKFADMVQTEHSLGYVYRLAKESERMLRATISGDTATMEEILELAHNTETGMTGYNNETELSAIVRLVYLAARERYDIQREDKAGIGYVDYIFYPVVDTSSDCIILELKVDHSAGEAIKQIKDRNYMQRFTGKLGEKPKYTGRILAVGIAYFKNDTGKRHECKIEVLREKLTH